MKNGLRKCTFMGKEHIFHTWFQEGGFDTNINGMDGSIDVGAVLEDEKGNVRKAFNITDIKFEEGVE